MARSTSPSLAVPDASGSRAGSSGARFLLNLLTSLRPGQWTKNLVVFAALIFAVKLFDARALIRSMAAVGIFCALSGVVYVMNDIVDRRTDRQHPLKSRRPIAAGTLPVAGAAGAAAALGSLALIAAFLVGWPVGLIAAAYL